MALTHDWMHYVATLQVSGRSEYLRDPFIEGTIKGCELGLVSDLSHDLPSSTSTFTPSQLPITTFNSRHYTSISQPHKHTTLVITYTTTHHLLIFPIAIKSHDSHFPSSRITATKAHIHTTPISTSIYIDLHSNGSISPSDRLQTFHSVSITKGAPPDSPLWGFGRVERAWIERISRNEKPQDQLDEGPQDRHNETAQDQPQITRPEVRGSRDLVPYES